MTWLTIHMLQNALKHGRGFDDIAIKQMKDARMLHWPVFDQLQLLLDESISQRGKLFTWTVQWGIQHQYPTPKNHHPPIEFQIFYDYYFKKHSYETVCSTLEKQTTLKFSRNMLQNRRQQAIQHLFQLLIALETPQSPERLSLRGFIGQKRLQKLPEQTRILARRLAVLQTPIPQNALPVDHRIWHLTLHKLLIEHNEKITIDPDLGQQLKQDIIADDHLWAAELYLKAQGSAESHAAALTHLQYGHAWQRLGDLLQTHWVQFIKTIGVAETLSQFECYFAQSPNTAQNTAVKIVYASILQEHHDVDRAIEALNDLIYLTDSMRAAQAHLSLAKAYRTKNLHDSVEHNFRSGLSKLDVCAADQHSIEKAQQLRIELLLERTHYWIQDRRNFNAAKEDLDRIKSDLTTISSPVLQARYHRASGTWFGNQGQFDAAETHFWRAWVLVSQTDDPHLQMHTLFNLGLVTLWQTQQQATVGTSTETTASITRSQSLLEQAHNRAINLGDLRVQGACLKTLGDVLFFEKEYEQAANFYRKALTPLSKINDENFEIVTQLSLLETLCASNQFQTARKLYAQFTTSPPEQPKLFEFLKRLEKQYPSLIVDEREKTLNIRQTTGYHYVLQNGSIDRRKYIELNECSKRQASKDLTAMVEQNWLEKIGNGRATHYIKKQTSLGHLD